MSAHAVFAVCVLIAVTVISDAAPDTSSTWIRAQPHQSLHVLMASIDERLQSLESARWVTILKQAEQRLDSLESSVRRLDTTFQDRLDKLERNLNSKELKDELSVEKLSHKIRDVMDSSYDRYNQRLEHTEERLKMVLKTMQMTTETTLNRLEKQHEDIQADVGESVTLLEDLKSQTTTNEDKLNNTHKAIQHHIQRLITPNQEELQKISGSLEHLGSRLNGSLAPVGLWGQSDGPLNTDVITSIRREIGSEGTKIINKINNMYNDLWRRVVSLESLIKNLNRATNATHREVLEEIRSFAHSDNRDFPGDSQENFLEVALDALDHKLHNRLLDLGHKVDDRFDTLRETQNLVMDSCFDSGICSGLESRLSQVLEKIFDVFSGKIDGFSNRTLDLDSLVMEMMELVKSQHDKLIKTVAHNTNKIVELAKNSGDASNLLHHSITRLADKTDNNFQELYEEVKEISNSSGKICVSNEKSIEENFEKQVIPEVIPKYTTENKLLVSTTAEPKIKTVKNYDTGILKITTDDFGPLSDNSSMASASILKPVVIKPSHPLTLDSSLLQVIELMSSNLTQNQKDTLLRFLNSTISLDNLEAVIQNTEAESDYDATAEIDDIETLNKTGVGNDQAITVASDTSVEAENISDEINDDIIQDEATTIDVVSIGNSTVHNGEDTMLKPNHNPDNTRTQGISEDLKIQLKLYALLLKIKQDDLNISELWKPLQKAYKLNDDVHNQHNLLPSLEKLCYGDDNIRSFELNHANAKMRDRLLLINQIITDKSLYEKISNICNTMTATLTTNDDASEEILPND